MLNHISCQESFFIQQLLKLLKHQKLLKKKQEKTEWTERTERTDNVSEESDAILSLSDMYEIKNQRAFEASFPFKINVN